MATSNSPELESYFPGLANSNYRFTSPATADYNCVAWAAGDDENWWEPDPMHLHFWPSGAPREYTREAYEAAFAQSRYVICQDADLTPDGECVAIYIKDAIPQHAARQLPDGTWTSKCGQLEDISHELSALEGDTYGHAEIILARSSNSEKTS